jgi:hypothetical protein
MKPTPDSRRKAIPPQKGLTQSMHWARNALQERFTRIVKANHLNSATNFEIGRCKLAHGLWRATIHRGKAGYDVKRRHAPTVPQFSRMNLRQGGMDAF